MFSAETLSIHDRLDGIEYAIKSISKDVTHDENARKRLLAVTKRSVTAFEPPAELIWRIIMQV